jgi:hypothetical protein
MSLASQNAPSVSELGDRRPNKGDENWHQPVGESL